MRILQRNKKGSQLVEFGAALSLLVSFVLVPVLNLSVIPLHWMMASEMINNMSRKLAFSESFSSARKAMAESPSLQDRLTSIAGIKVDTLDLNLRIVSVAGERIDVLLVSRPGEIPSDWLPNGAKSPCTYSLVLKTKLLISPAFLMSGVGFAVPGLTAPVPVPIVASRAWENLGKNPETGRFFMNE
ncbi:MAG: hypothetical protein K2X81_04565 [Candidatus Obscuribacterales bacterium]|nr:hypothetical protein [Candidatus Obscuribacterales bacterium]